ncbi:thioredoxin [Amorphoplanes nipponensis]|uniref:Thioredoxin n=1 Tax=Actinoplanes nipponensis TaxID=135950 RepID=A0A919JE31_9ACTN|nr:thioredoxin domain-containing protein [Actinoplanes nipponensis]GIE47655.1 thioredoxin [Actinoplanes nipponensis]
MLADPLTEVTDDTFAALVLGNPLPVVVDFWAEWCPPCGPVARTLAELAGEFPGVAIMQLNADENPVTMRTYRVLSMPTLLFFRGGVVVHTIVGARPKSQLRQALSGAFEPYVNR